MQPLSAKKRVAQAQNCVLERFFMFNRARVTSILPGSASQSRGLNRLIIPPAYSMQAFLAALQAETAGNLLQAIISYEEALLEPQTPLAAFTNLAFLYWDVGTDYGVQTAFLQAHALPDHVVYTYPAQWRRVLHLAQQRFPAEAEPRYWYAYFTEEETYADQPTPYLLIDLPAQWPNCLLPFLYRYQHGLATNQAALTQLYQIVRGAGTHKDRWIAHMIESLRRFEGAV